MEWLPPTATDVSYERRYGLATGLRYECTIPERDLLEFSARNGWVLRIERVTDEAGSKGILAYRNRLPNGGGTTVVYEPSTRRLSVSQSRN